MNVPLEVSFRSVEKSPAVEELIRDRAAKLETYHDHIQSCRVTVEQNQRFQSSGVPFRVRLDITVPPGHEIAICREPGKGDMHTTLEAEIRSAFDAADRQLGELKQRQQGEVKFHEYQSVQAVVDKLFPLEGYGFLRTIEDARQIYFHKNSLEPGAFERLRIGSGVRYTESQGEQGPQASFVQIIDKSGLAGTPLGEA
jgi:cold shock CspA family protein/ribosome-associated translation inhibitor RaiA